MKKPPCIMQNGFEQVFSGYSRTSA